MKNEIRIESGKLMDGGETPVHTLCQLTPQQVPTTDGSRTQWVAVVKKKAIPSATMIGGRELLFQGRASYPLRAVQVALCYEKIAEQGWG